MNVLTTALAIAIPAGMMILKIYIDIRIRFAPTTAHAIREVNLILFKVFSWVINVYSAGLIIWFFASSRPVDRLFIFAVMVNAFYLFTVCIVHLLNRIIDLIQMLNETDDAIIELTGIRQKFNIPRLKIR